MAWSYRTRRTFTRTARRSFRRRGVARPRYSHRRRRVRRSNKTTSAYVTLTQNAQWTLFQDETTPTTSGLVRTWNAFQFSPVTVPGFLDYRSTYSHFRIVKAKLFMARSFGESSPGTTFNYLTVGSRPFAATQMPTSPGAPPANFVPAQLETDLRQAKWQKLRYPNSTSLVVPVGFHPYTMIQTYGPGVNTGGTAWQRVWEANRWMPFSWAFPVGSSPATARGIAFYGPYMVVDGPNGDVPGAFSKAQVECTLRLTVQFKGQR